MGDRFEIAYVNDYDSEGVEENPFVSGMSCVFC